MFTIMNNWETSVNVRKKKKCLKESRENNSD